MQTRKWNEIVYGLRRYIKIGYHGHAIIESLGGSY